MQPMDPHDLPTPLSPELLPLRPDGTRPKPEPRRAAERRTGAVFPVSPYAPLAHGLMLAGATAAVFLAGKPQQGALGVFLVFAGAAMIICPPRQTVEWRLWLLAAATVVCGSLALLPERWFAQPAWRRALDITPPVVMPGTVSTTPALTVFWLAVLAISLLIGLFLLAHPIRSRWLLRFAFAAAVVAGVYGALGIYAKETGWHYPFASDAAFGFFPNRNHTATLLFVGSLLALGVLGVVLREGRWLTGAIAAAVIAVCAVGLGFFSSSRGGIVFFVAGVVAWVAGLGRLHRDPRLTVSLAAVLLASGLLFLLSGGEVRDRLLGVSPTPTNRPATAAVAAHAGPSSGADEIDPMHNLSNDFRLKIYRDAADAVRDFPLTGMGLGTFAQVFPQYRRASLLDAPAIHPESDWLMLVAEAGFLSAVCLLLLIGLAAGRLAPQRDHAYWPVRWGCAVAAGAAALHGVVDVPVHRAPLGWWLLCLAGLALQSGRLAQGGRSRTQQVFFIIGGVTAVLLGSALIRGQWFGGTPLPPFATDKVQQAVYAAFQHGDFKGARTLLDQAIRTSPMYDPPYFQLGILLAQAPHADAGVDAAFKAQRLVNPNRSVVSLNQGVAWFANDPDRTAALWLDALAREQRISRALGRTPGYAVAYFRDLVKRGAEQPDTQTDLWKATRQDPAYALAWLETAEPDLVHDQLASLGTDEHFLGGLDEPARRRFLTVWYAHGDRDALGRFLNGRKGWETAAWPVHVRTLADAGQYEALVREVSQRDGISLALPDAAPAALPADEPGPTPMAGRESIDPVAAFAAAWREGNVVTARRLLNEAVATAPGSGSAETWRLKAALAAHDADWKAAWAALERAVRISRPAEWL